MKRYILFTPGPVNIKEGVRKTLLLPDICHREPEFSNILLNCRRKILEAFGIARGYDVVFLSGSGTASLEAAVASGVPAGRKLLVVNNGIYAERIATIAGRYNIGVSNLEFDIRERPILASVEDRIKKDSSIAAVAMVHHETSTGLLNPADEIGALARRYGKLYILDSISGLAGEGLDFAIARPALCVGTANKCIESVPGVSFVLARKDALNLIRRIRPRSLYFDLPMHLALQRKGEVAFTPAVQAFYALDAALDELIKEGVQNRIGRYRARAAILRKGFEDMGLGYLLESRLHSNTITALLLPENVTYKRLHDRLKAKGFVIYAGQSRLKNKIFRIANMGQISAASCREFLEELKTALR